MVCLNSVYLTLRHANPYKQAALVVVVVVVVGGRGL